MAFRKRKRRFGKRKGKRRLVRKTVRRRIRFGGRPRRSARQGVVNLKSTLEVKFQEHAIRTDNVAYMDGSELAGPSNSLCLLAGLFGGDYATPDDVSTGLIPGTGCTDVVGCWSTPAYPSSMKLDIDYKALAIVDNQAFPQPNLRILHGFYKNTGDKMDADLASNATWIASIRAALLKELFDSDYTADFLAYTQKSRNIKILSDRLILPRKSIAHQLVPDSTMITKVMSPNSQLSYKWPHSKFKSRLSPTIQAGSDPVFARMVPHNQWVPFLLMLAPGLPADAAYGHLVVRSVTKAYFHDA